jgi:hypothetical protein
MELITAKTRLNIVRLEAQRLLDEAETTLLLAAGWECVGIDDSGKLWKSLPDKAILLQEMAVRHIEGMPFRIIDRLKVSKIE